MNNENTTKSTDNTTLTSDKRRIFDHPFSKAYWKLAAGELGSLKMIIIAAMLTALRIAIKQLSIPLDPNRTLKITFGFIINATGSMIYGPVVAVIASAISDTVGAMMSPDPYYFPFIFEEIAGGVLFALFYYRAKLSTTRVMLGRFAVTVVCNLILNPLIMISYYRVVLGKTYAFLTLPRLIKNVALFPVQTLVLILLFNALIPITNRMELTYAGSRKLQISRSDVITLISWTIISAAAVAGYILWSTADKEDPKRPYIALAALIVILILAGISFCIWKVSKKKANQAG